MTDVDKRRVWVLQKELEQLIAREKQMKKDCRNRVYGVAIVALVEFLWILLKPTCGMYI